MPTTTHVERISICTDDRLSTAYEEDPDLFLKLQEGGIIRSGDCMGTIVVKLRIDEEPSHEVLLDAYQALGSRIDVLDQAIEQITIARNALQRIQDGEDINRPEMAAEGAQR